MLKASKVFLFGFWSLEVSWYVLWYTAQLYQGLIFLFEIFSESSQRYLSPEKLTQKNSQAIFQNYNLWMVQLTKTTKFTKLPSAKWLFCTTVNFIIQELKFCSFCVSVSLRGFRIQRKFQTEKSSPKRNHSWYQPLR